MADFIIFGGAAVVVVLIMIKHHKDKKNGKSACGSCNGCASKDSCGKK